METTLNDKHVVAMRDIVKTFPGVRALDHVNFKLLPGEIHGLVGKNGAGKSTLMNVLTGIYPPDQGEIWVSGEHVHPMTTARARQVGLAYVHQHSQLVPALSIAENLFSGEMPTGNLGFVNWRAVYHQSEELLRRLSLEIDVKRKVEGLSVAEKQIIEIATALFADAKVIILDEATAPLPKNEVELLFSFVRRQRDQGASFIYISHYLEEVFELCDKVTVLRDGGFVGTYEVKDLDESELVRLISGEELQRFERDQHVVEGQPVIQIEGLNRPGAYAEIDLTIQKGEIVGLTGLEGCGKAALALGLFGIEPLGSGRVLVDGQPYAVESPEEALAHGIAYLPRDRHGQGIVGIRSVRENISLSILRRITRYLGFLKLQEERAHVGEYIDKLGILTPSMQQPVEFLSGGNQQKVVFAKLASINPKLLLLHEPTQGVDVQAKVEILKIVDEMAQQGVGVAFVSEEIRELLNICDRIIVLYGGKIVAEFDTSDPNTTAEDILLAVEGSKANYEL